MPTDKDFKRLVRTRMAATGERYTEARAALAPTPEPERGPEGTTPEPGGPDWQRRQWLDLLGDPQQNQAVFPLLKALPAEELRPLAVEGTRHANPRVRRRCCQLLDDLSLAPDTLAALEACTADPDPRVRGAALHALACENCKPDGVCLDQRVIAERAAGDPSASVRRGVAMNLVWNPEQSDDWAVALATRFLSDPSPKVRGYARAALDRIDRQRRTDEERRLLPEPLRSKTERHRGRWVAVLDGRIVAVDPPPTWTRRHPDARLYFVAPAEECADTVT